MINKLGLAPCFIPSNNIVTSATIGTDPLTYGIYEPGIIYCNSTNPMTMALPSGANGQLLFIRKHGAGNITVTGSMLKDNYSATSSLTIEDHQLWMF